MKEQVNPAEVVKTSEKMSRELKRPLIAAPSSVATASSQARFARVPAAISAIRDKCEASTPKAICMVASVDWDCTVQISLIVVKPILPRLPHHVHISYIFKMILRIVG
jgi:hypothetical protein